MAIPSVSIVLPTYNRAATLPRAVESVLSQSYSDFELIIVDDGSSDQTKEVISKYKDQRIRYVYQNNSGASAARNAGIQLARASYVAFQDSDDEWLADKLRAQMGILLARPQGQAVVYSDLLRVSANGSAWVLASPEVVRGRLIDPYTGDYQTFGIGLQTSIISRAELISIGGFDNRLPRFIDLDLFSRLAINNRCYRLPSPLVKYHETEGITSSFVKLAKARNYLLEKNALFFSKKRKYRAMQLMFQADALWKAGMREKALQCARTAVRTYPWSARIAAKGACIRWFSPQFTEKVRSRGGNVSRRPA